MLEKPLEEFHKDSSRKSGYKYSCKSCENERNKVDYKQNKKDRKRTKEEYNQKTNYSSKNWRLNKDRLRTAHKKWREVNRHITNALISAYRARKLNATPSWLNEEQKRQVENFYWLAQDLKRVSGEEYHVDHIIPLKGENVCGLHVPWNLQVLPKDLNLSKKNKHSND